MVLLWQDVGFNRIRTVPNRCPTVARSMSAVCCCSQSTSPPNRGPIHVSRMLLLAECTCQIGTWSTSAAWCCSQSASPSNRGPIYVSHIVSLAVLSDLCQPHSVARSAVRSMSVAWCCSQSASQLPDLRQPHSVARSVVRSTSAA